MKRLLPVKYDTLKNEEKRFVREQYIKEQNNLCWYCGCNINIPAPMSIRKKKINFDVFPKGFRKYPIHLHHDHDTGFTVGAVHSYCNAVLWQYEGK